MIAQIFVLQLVSYYCTTIFVQLLNNICGYQKLFACVYTQVLLTVSFSVSSKVDVAI